MSGRAYHQFVSAIADGANAGLARPSNWNAGHDLYWDVNTQTGITYTIAAADSAALVTFNNASAVAVTLPQANSGAITPGTLGFFKGWFCLVKNLGAGTVTITPTTSTINGASTFKLPAGFSAIIISDGTNYTAIRMDIATEGSFTPTLAFGGGSTGITYSTQIGRWKRTFDSVQFWLNVGISSKGSSTGAASIGGLPITSDNSAGFLYTIAPTFMSTVTSVGTMQAQIAPGSTQIDLSQLVSGSNSNLTDANFTGSTQILASGTYPVTL